MKESDADLAAPGEFTAPQPLNNGHKRMAFDCGQPDLTAWIRHRALLSEGRSARTYVICGNGSAREASVFGYYTLSAASVLRDGLPTAKHRKNMPTHVPAMLVGRLAVDLSVQGRGLGTALLHDAIERVIGISKEAGVRVIVVHPIDENAAAFYGQYGFIPSLLSDSSMILLVETALATLPRH